LREMLTSCFALTPSVVLMRRSIFERCGGFNEQFLDASYEDRYLWLLTREHGPFEYVNELLVSYSLKLSYCEEKWFVNLCKFKCLVLKRYGPRARPMIRQMSSELAQVAMQGVIAQLPNHPRAALLWAIWVARLRPGTIFRLSPRVFRYRNLRRLLSTFRS